MASLSRYWWTGSPRVATPKMATVCSFDIGRLGQVRPGQRVRFAAISMREAHALLGEAEAALAADSGLG